MQRLFSRRKIGISAGDGVEREARTRWADKLSVDKLVARLEELSSKTRATYNWGPEKTSAEYFKKWHLHVSRGYLKQLKEASSFE